MITLHWILEYVAVFCGYVFLLFIWPSVVFRKHLAKKSKIYWFSFCVTAQIILINTFVLTFGLIHILNKWTIVAFFYGVFLLVILRRVGFSIERIEEFRHLVTGVYGKKRLLVKAVSFLGRCLKEQCSKLWTMLSVRLGEYIILSVILIFGMIYFSYGAFQENSYGFGDGYVHHSWIYGLTEGKIFSGGIYPAGMHCFVYCLHALFGIEIYSSLLFLGGIHVITFLIAAYCLLREIFHWRYTPLFALVMFLTLDSISVNAVYGMSRFQWTLPQEFGLFTQFLCALYLIRYLKNANYIVRKGKSSKFYWDENLLIFTLAFTASVVVHFYPTIMAFFLCVSVVVFAPRRVFHYKRFIPLITAVLFGLLVAVFPMIGAFASSNTPLQGSFDWAFSVIKGTDSESEAQSQEVAQETKPESNAIDVLKDKILQVYKNNYQTVYGETRGAWIVALTGVSALLWALFRLTAILLRRYSRFQVRSDCFDGYPAIIFAAVLFMIEYAVPTGFPQLIAGSRLCSTEQILNLAVIVMPIDMIFSLLALCCRERLLRILSVFCTMGIYVATIACGVYHGYLYDELTRYNSSVMVTNSIIRTLPRNSYTIVSPTDELYSIVQYGYHEDLLTFVEKSKEIEYMLPTKHVFVYVEKRPIHYAQRHFFKGPRWLALTKYPDFFPADITSQYPEILASNISQDAANKDLLYENPWHVYVRLNNRTILESKAYEWCKRFSEIYPRTLNIYYEDDDFVCYHFEQEPNAPYNLAIE